MLCLSFLVAHALLTHTHSRTHPLAPPQLAENIQRSYEGDDVLAHVTTDGSSTPEDCAQAWMEAHANLAFEDTITVS